MLFAIKQSLGGTTSDDPSSGTTGTADPERRCGKSRYADDSFPAA